MLILWGMKDFVYDQPVLDEWVRRFPESNVVRFLEAGHYLFDDEPDGVASAVSEFLQSPGLIRECAL
jgi:haloalkane dehalogenase